MSSADRQNRDSPFDHDEVIRRRRQQSHRPPVSAPDDHDHQHHAPYSTSPFPPPPLHAQQPPSRADVTRPMLSAPSPPMQEHAAPTPRPSINSPPRLPSPPNRHSRKQRASPMAAREREKERDRHQLASSMFAGAGGAVIGHRFGGALGATVGMLVGALGAEKWNQISERDTDRVNRAVDSVPRPPGHRDRKSGEQTRDRAMDQRTGQADAEGNERQGEKEARGWNDYYSGRVPSQARR